MLDAHVVKKRRDFTVDVAFRVEAHAALAVFGPSGAGKTTVLSCVAGIEIPDMGRVIVDGRTLFPPQVPLPERDIGYLTQDADLFPHLSVAANVTFGFDHSRPYDAAWVAELRERLHLDEVWADFPARISGGQARRVALARMLARRPMVVLLDEPFTALDRDLVRELIDDIVMWQREIGFALIVVDHEADVLERLCSRVVAIEEGAVVQEGTWPELHAHPATPALSRLLAPL